MDCRANLGGCFGLCLRYFSEALCSSLMSSIMTSCIAMPSSKSYMVRRSFNVA
nr:MAG TPA: hypothetical protein [Caudoviricetes sp.]